MDGVILTPLKQIYHPQGDIFHVLKNSDDSFHNFGEAYFSSVNQGEIKGWKKHTKMILNIVVAIGEIEFVIYDEKLLIFHRVVLSQNKYQRLTLNPNLWLAFRGVGSHNMLLNIASIEHDPEESLNCRLDEISYDW